MGAVMLSSEERCICCHLCIQTFYVCLCTLVLSYIGRLKMIWEPELLKLILTESLSEAGEEERRTEEEFKAESEARFCFEFLTCFH